MNHFSRIIGLDPGETTGWFEIQPEDLQVFYAQLRREEVEPALESRLVLGKVLVGSERFVTTTETAKKGPEHGAQDIEGVVKNTCQKYDDTILVFNTPAEKKRVPDSLLKNLHWWVPNHRHAMDAARHALTVLADHDPILFARIVQDVVL